MINSYKKALIIAPHSDDEIFTLPFIYSNSNKFKELDLLIIENDSKRIREAFLSANINSLNLILMPSEYNFKGLYFHKKVDLLINYFLDIWDNYDLILAPLLEGGHQDHDTVCAAILFCKELSKVSPKLILYSTYRNYLKIPWIYQCGLSTELFSDYLLEVKIPKKIIYLITKTILLCYGSQYKSWLLLLPAILISMIRSNYGKFVLANELKLKDIMNIMPQKPLYQIYRGLKPQEWLETIEEKCQKINKS